MTCTAAGASRTQGTGNLSGSVAYVNGYRIHGYYDRETFIVNVTWTSLIGHFIHPVGGEGMV